MSEFLPNDPYWKVITWKDYDKSNMDFCEFADSLDNRDDAVFTTIENIFGSICISIRYTSKLVGYDELFKCYTRPKNIDDEADYETATSGNYLRGCRNFVYFPGGLICFNKINKPLYELTDIGLMLNFSCIPNYFIRELNERIIKNNRESLFTITRSNGAKQIGIINENSSIRYHKTSNTDTWNWIIYVGFDEYDEKLTKEQRENSIDMLIDRKVGNFSKNVFLKDFLQDNNIDKIRIEKSKYTDNINKIMRENTTTELPVFYKKSYGEYDCEHELYHYKEHFNYIHENVKNYFFSKLDEYLVCVVNSMKKEGINCIIE